MAPPVECHRCGQKFPRPLRLRAHLENPCGDQLVCAVCGKQFKSYVVLQKHISLASCGPDVILKCDSCNKTFASKKTLRQHVESHTKKYKCSECPQTYVRNEDLNHHIQHSHVNPKHQCPRCKKILASEDRLYYHFDRIHATERMCDVCHGTYINYRQYRKHREECRKVNGHRPTSYPCIYCRKTFSEELERQSHRQLCDDYRTQMRLFRGAGATQDSDSDDGDEEKTEEEVAAGSEEPKWTSTYALKKNVSLHSVPVQGHHDLGVCLIGNKRTVTKKIEHHVMSSKQGIKFSLVARVAASREKPAEGVPSQVEVERKTVYLQSKIHTLYKTRDAVVQAVEEAFTEVLTQADHMNVQGSSWVMSEVMALDLNIAKCEPLRGSSYIPTPTRLKNAKKALLNIKNYGDSDCFRLCVAAALHPAPVNRCRPHNYTRFIGELQMGNLKYLPMKVKDISRFEALNPTISICVLYEDTLEEEKDEFQEEARKNQEDQEDQEEGSEEEEEDEEGEAECLDRDTARSRKEIIVPLYCTKEKKENHVTLLLLERDGRFHYVLVQDIHAFLYSQTWKRARLFYCCYCLNTLPSATRLEEHEAICRTFGAQRIEYGRPGADAKFDRFSYPKLQRVPYTAYYDFESALQKVDEDGPAKATAKTQHHEALAYSIAVVDWKGNLVKHVSHSADKDVAAHFVDTVLQIEEEMWQIRPNYPLHMSAAQKKDFDDSFRCYLCRGHFKKREHANREHDHLEETHNYRGASCAECNSALKRTTFFPLIGHGASHYDMHLVFRAFIKHPAMENKRISVLAKTIDSYRSANIFIGKDGRSVRLMDSFNFFSTSLDAISRHLSPSDLTILFTVYPDPAHQELLRRKGVFCYEFAESYEKLVAQKTLPARQDFYSSLNNSLPSEEDYARAQQVWDGMGCANLLQYMMHYLNADVLLLAAFFTKFKAMTFKKYGLEVCHFVSISSLTWCQALKFTNEQVEIITDPDMYQMFELQKRGGMACIMQRYSVANVPGTSTYDPEKPERHILIFDVNALYSNEMCKKLPYSDYTWVGSDQLAKIDWSRITENDDKMYTVEVDLEYPQELHRSHDEWPCAVERCQVPERWLSPYQQGLAQHLSKGQLQEPKLIAHLGPRRNYVVHGTVLSLYLRLGLRVTKFHRGVEYVQKAWLKPYIEDLMRERQRTQLPFEQQAFKQLSNSTYGYLLRNPRSDRQVEIVRTPRRMRKLAAKPNFKSFTIFGEDLVAVEKTPAKIRLAQCVSAGVGVLDTSKKTMLELYWSLKGQFGDRMKTLFTDTDSQGVEIESPDIVGEMRNLEHILDTSGLLPTHPLYSTQYARVPGRLKIEYGEMTILRFAAVRAKCYAVEYETQDNNISNIYKCKGVQRNALKQGITFEDYKKCIFNDVQKQLQFCSLRSDGTHQIYTVKQCKTALRNFDNKRYILSDGCTTRAFCSADPDHPVSILHV
ncbi:hypothetical protein FOCC_FOCC012870 [Frankliniella occidentalis]|nr:hypothetical protein FOCC_FOCC012870 [Frankliniella occidentalis]